MPVCVEQTYFGAEQASRRGDRPNSDGYCDAPDRTPGPWETAGPRPAAFGSWQQWVWAFLPLPRGVARASGAVERVDATKTGVAELFERDLQEWRSDTRFSSSLAAKLSHPAYLRILALGRAALPLILKDLQQGGGHWFSALRAVAREDPVPPEHRSLPRLMREDWLRWGAEKGLIDDEVAFRTALPVAG